MVDPTETYRKILLRVYGRGDSVSFPAIHLADAVREVTKVIDNGTISRRANSMNSAGFIRMKAPGIYEFTSKAFELMNLPKTEEEEVKNILHADVREEDAQ